MSNCLVSMSRSGRLVDGLAGDRLGRRRGRGSRRPGPRSRRRWRRRPGSRAVRRRRPRTVAARRRRRRRGGRPARRSATGLVRGAARTAASSVDAATSERRRERRVRGVDHRRIVARDRRSAPPADGPGPPGRVAFLTACRLDPESAARSVCDRTNPKGSILPPSDRGRRLGRRLRSFCVREAPAQVSAPCRPLCQNRGHGTHLVRTHLRPPARPGRGRRDRPLPVGRRADRARHHRRHRHVQPPRRHTSCRAPRASSRATATPSPVQPRRRVRPRRPGRVRGQGGPRHRRPDLPRRRQGRGGGQAGRRSSSSSTASTRSTSATSATC